MTKKRTLFNYMGLLVAIVLVMLMCACSTVSSEGKENNEAVSGQDGITLISELDGKLSSQAGDCASFEAYDMETGELDYWLYTPENPEEDMPLIVYLHGAGGRGENLAQVTAEEDFPKYLQNGELGDVRSYVIIPQLSSGLRSWSDVDDLLYGLIQETVCSLSIDEDNISLAGFSMGGTGVWELAAEYPALFSRIAPLAGSAREVLKHISLLEDVPVRAFVGADDTVIAPNSSQQMIRELKKAGADAHITVLDGADHVSVPYLVFHDESITLVDWLISGRSPSQSGDGEVLENDGMNMYENSDFIEKEQPELSEETKQLIAIYQSEPSDENYFNLREKVIEDYNAVVERKETKLNDLKAETRGKPGGEAIVEEMEALVQEIYITYWDRINSTMLRFTDPRLLEWKIAAAPRYEYIPVMGAGESIYVKRTPVTNAEYAEFLDATGYPAPPDWADGTYPVGEGDYPVNFVSYEDAQAYCDWLTEKDGVDTYRLPSESEWELAAGHMPKDASFNCGVNDGMTVVEEYADVTRGAHGAVDFWGNVWEWTSTVRTETVSRTILGVKGGSWKAERTDCRTEYREEGRDSSMGYDDVGFRVIQVKNGEEPEKAVDLTVLHAPEVTASTDSADSITLSWEKVSGATEYQIYEYCEETGLLSMLTRTEDTAITMENLEPGSTHSYIVQPISYVEIADNVSPEYRVSVTCRT